jgi:hypothetical protein
MIAIMVFPFALAEAGRRFADLICRPWASYRGVGWIGGQAGRDGAVAIASFVTQGSFGDRRFC